MIYGLWFIVVTYPAFLTKIVAKSREVLWIRVARLRGTGSKALL